VNPFASPLEGWRAAAHPEGGLRVWDDPGPGRVGAGRGLLRLRLGKRGSGGPRRYDQPDRWVYPGTPVVLIDGRPAVQGFGAAVLELPAGPHDVEVQAGGSRGWWHVDVPDGGTAALDFINDLDEAPASGRRWVLGPPGLKRVDRRWTALWWLVPSLATASVLVLLPAMVAGFEAPTVWPAWAVAVATLWALAARLHLRRASCSAQAKRAQPRWELPVDPPPPAPAFITPLYGSPGPPGEGLGMAVLDLRWELVWQRLDSPEGTGLEPMREYGEPLPSPRRPWLEPPTLLVDDHLVEARWARLCVPLRPGTHRIDLAVRRSDAGEDFVTLVREFAIEAGAMTHLRVTAEAVQHLAGGVYSLEVVGLGCESREGATRLPPYAAPRPPLRPMDGEDRPHRPYSIAS
jgi:hypothetical protein